MNAKLKNFIKLFSVPLILLAIYLSVYMVWKLLDLPSDAELVVIVKNWFATYGLWIVFVGALIEGFLLLGQYFPGGFIIFLGVISAGKHIPRAAEVVSIVCLAFFISYTLNYWVGKYGWYRLLIKFGLKQSLEHAKEKLEKQGLNAVILSYWEPNLASITATAAGILQIPLRKFQIYSAVGIIVWNIFWGVLVYSLGENALKIVGFKYIIVIFLIWVAVILIKHYLFDKQSKPVTNEQI
jgi:membrane protein DedA with SNARE-associated domain